MNLPHGYRPTVRTTLPPSASRVYPTILLPFNIYVRHGVAQSRMRNSTTPIWLTGDRVSRQRCQEPRSGRRPRSEAAREFDTHTTSVECLKLTLPIGPVASERAVYDVENVRGFRPLARFGASRRLARRGPRGRHELRARLLQTGFGTSPLARTHSPYATRVSSSPACTLGEP